MSHAALQPEQVSAIRADLTTAQQRMEELASLEVLFRGHEAAFQLGLEKTQALLVKLREVQGKFSHALDAVPGTGTALAQFTQDYQQIQQLMGELKEQSLTKKFGEMLEAQKQRQALQAQALRLRTAVELRRQEVEKKEALVQQAQAHSARYTAQVSTLQAVSSGGSTCV